MYHSYTLAVLFCFGVFIFILFNKCNYSLNALGIEKCEVYLFIILNNSMLQKKLFTPKPIKTTNISSFITSKC